jgi:hypothetical protein
MNREKLMILGAVVFMIGTGFLSAAFIVFLIQGMFAYAAIAALLVILLVIFVTSN